MKEKLFSLSPPLFAFPFDPLWPRGSLEPKSWSKIGGRTFASCKQKQNKESTEKPIAARCSSRATKLLLSSKLTGREAASGRSSGARS
jgi:hypothetical protein